MLVCPLPIIVCCILCRFATASTEDELPPRPQIDEDPHKVPPYIPKHLLVHMDLKGAPPKVTFYNDLFPFLKRMGATGLLIEYEDMFPFWGPIHPLAASNAYTRQEVEEIVRLAEEHQLEVIPLVQTFGHLEFALKLGEFSSLREVNQHPQALCPSRNGSRELIRHMVDQVMELHKGIRWLHIGCDEVSQLAQCDNCVQRLHDHGRSGSSLNGKHWIFLQHVRWVADYVKETHGAQPIIWDDMLRGLPERDLQQHLGGGIVQPMVWVEVSLQVVRFVDTSVWRKYARVFPTVWGAGTLKGAFGSSHSVVDSRRQLECTAEWMRILRMHGPYFPQGPMGYVLTGWQRYDHFETLCELSPAGMPSLAANLILSKHGGRLDDSLFTNVSAALKCKSHAHRRPSMRSIQKNPYLWEYARCQFPGQKVFRLLHTFKQLRARVRKHIHTVAEAQAWLTGRHNVGHNFSSSSPASSARIKEAILWHTDLILAVDRFKQQIEQALLHIFDRSIVAEWLERNVMPMVRGLAKLDADAASVMDEDNSWPSALPRPLFAQSAAAENL